MKITFTQFQADSINASEIPLGIKITSGVNNLSLEDAAKVVLALEESAPWCDDGRARRGLENKAWIIAKKLNQ
jgi:hypothetical protein